MKYEIPEMLKTGGGAIVNMSSVGGLIGFRGFALYIASKHAVLGLTKTAALEYAKSGIRINAVCPAVIETDMVDRAFGKEGEMRQQLASMHPIGRVGKPEEIASAVLYLCSAGASFITGQSITLDGGFTAQ
jgi:NAD(P)-dependent dehydrogenase (short-subunit alcohol dehydrogenase family)